MATTSTSARLLVVWKHCESCSKRFSQKGPGRPAKYCPACRVTVTNRRNWEKHGERYRKEGISGGNPKDSPWHSTPNEKRNRKQVGVTLSDEAREKLARLADAAQTGTSATVERLILEAKE